MLNIECGVPRKMSHWGGLRNEDVVASEDGRCIVAELQVHDKVQRIGT